MIFWTAHDIYYLVEFLLGDVSLVLTGIVNIKIYVTVQLHKNQIQALQVQQEVQTDEMAHLARFIKSAVSVFYVYVTFAVCYLPYFIHRMQIWRTTRSSPGTSCMKVRLVRPRCFVLTMLPLRSLAAWTV